MSRVQLVHWKADEVDERIARLERAGFEVVYFDLNNGGFRKIRNDPPAALVIDLARMPSLGRAVAIAWRQSRLTRNVPLVFVDGVPDKVARMREALPDATYTTWSSIKSAVTQAIANPVRDPVVLRSNSGPYSGTPLTKKLGIKAGSVVALVNAPDGFETKLEPLPDNVVLLRGSRGRRDLTVWFVSTLRKLESQIDNFADAIGEGGLWIAWPKKASGVPTDVTEANVRSIGLAAGLVDYKVCAIDEIWSAHKFARKKRE